METREFKKKVWRYYRASGRHDLPWRKTHDPYRILVSEVMLQQTQVSRVLGKYPQFLKKFPNLRALANASVRYVLVVWQGLGYNRRALLLKRAAESVMRDFNGTFPKTAAELESLPGVGQSTRGAIMAFAFGEPTVFIETNIRAVFIAEFFPRKKKVSDKEILPLVEKTLDRKNPRAWYYALMDYGVHLKQTTTNPSRKSKHHVRQSPFKGSNREIRAKILTFLFTSPKTEPEILAHIGKTKHDAGKNLENLIKEGFITRKGPLFAAKE